MMEAQKNVTKKELRTTDVNEATFLRENGKRVNCGWHNKDGAYYSYPKDCEQLISEFRETKEQLETSLQEFQENFQRLNETYNIKK